MDLHLETVDEVLCGLVVRVQDEALVTEAHQLDVLHLKEEASGGRPGHISYNILKCLVTWEYLGIFCHLGRREGWRALLKVVSVDFRSIRKSLKPLHLKTMIIIYT